MFKQKNKNKKKQKITIIIIIIIIIIQASLPVKNGGLGVRRVSSLAPSAFLASAAGTRDLQDMILSKCDASVDSAVDNALVQWSIAHGQAGALPPVDSASTKQQEWDKPSIAADVARLNASLYQADIIKLVCW